MHDLDRGLVDTLAGTTGQHSSKLMRQVTRFHGQFAVDAHHVDGVVDGADIHQADGSGSGLHNLEDVGVGVHYLDGVLVSGDQRLQFAGDSS